MGWNATGPSGLLDTREGENVNGSPEAAFLKFHFSPGGACREVNLTLKFWPLFFTPFSEKHRDKRGNHATHSF